jgi:hypothetical protein
MCSLPLLKCVLTYLKPLRILEKNHSFIPTFYIRTNCFIKNDFVFSTCKKNVDKKEYPPILICIFTQIGSLRNFTYANINVEMYERFFSEIINTLKYGFLVKGAYAPGSQSELSCFVRMRQYFDRLLLRVVLIDKYSLCF